MLARMWFDGWQDAHAGILPEALARHRTLASFLERILDGLERIRVAEVDGAPAGLSFVKGDELYQFYLAASARRTGVAQSLMQDTLTRLRASGVATAWLACAIGNDRAAHFYTKAGWRRVGEMTSRLETPEGVFPLNVWRYEIDL